MPLTPSRQPTFRLSGIGVNYTVYVEAPPAGAEVDARGCPVLLCLDGDDQFTSLVHARDAAAERQRLRPLMLVGLGYGGSYQDPGNRRGRDYTPCPIEGADEGGGADAFLEFLQTGLWPELSSRYPVHPTERGIAGHSLGALFALHALFKPRPFFDRVLASAPSIWWGDRAVLQTVAAIQAQRTELPAYVFLGLGEDDSESMHTDLDLLEAQLSAQPIPGLEIHRARIPGRDHYTSVGPGFTAGLAALYAL